MLVRIPFVLFVLLALLGDARIFLFVMNRFVYGNHREEQSPWQWLMYVVPPLLLVFTASAFIRRVAPVGTAWLVIASAVGLYWLLERIRINYVGVVPLSGIREEPPTIVRLRRAHVPFESLRKLGAHNDVYDIEVTHHEIVVDDLPPSFDGYRIAFLTDTHIARFVRTEFYDAIVAQVTAFDPEAILLGGDFVTFHRHVPLLRERLFDRLRARAGLFAILGNHDYWAGADEVIETLRACGVRFIVNTNVVLRRGDDVLPLAGIDEVYRGKPDPAAAFDGIDPAQPCLAISHHPDIVDVLPRRRIDLLLCGHTHGGQIRFPFFGAVVVPSLHEGEYAAGFHRIGPLLMYVSRGVGAIPPLRILCRPEVATFTLRRGHRTND